MKKGRTSYSPEKILTSQEQSALRCMLERYRYSDLRDTTMLLMALEIGGRPSEIVGLLWSDVNWEDRSIYLHTLKLGNPRVLPLGNNVFNRLKKLHTDTQSERIFPITYVRFWQIWDKFRPCKKKLHSLRHTFAFNLYKKSGKDIWLTQRALGHMHLSTTALYMQVHATLDDLRKVMA